jgi:large subunit ribosomal protein L17
MPAHRKLGRDSKQRRQLLRNLIDALFTRETLTTTWPKAKEAQSLAEKLITLGKKNDEESRRKAQSIFTVRVFPHPRG